VLRLAALAFTLMLVVPATGARAQAEIDAEARSLFEAGRTAFDAGRFEPALDYFTRAYELSHRGALLFNVASAAERLRRDALALDAYRRYLVEVPDAPNRAFVQARVEFLTQTETEPTAAASPTPAPAPVEPVSTALVPDQPQDQAGSENLAEAWWLWTIVAVVVVGAGVGIGVGVALSSPTGGGTEAPVVGNFGGGVATALVRF
jgi:tetratricopeptide (TPR) repeat protein